MYAPPAEFKNMPGFRVCVKTLPGRVIPNEVRNLALKTRHLRDPSSLSLLGMMRIVSFHTDTQARYTRHDCAFRGPRVTL